MLPLTSATLSTLTGVAVPSYDRSALQPGIAHFGVGNFHRSHQAVYLDRYLNAGGSPKWGIVGIGISDSPAAREKARRFDEQDCLYTVTELDPAGTSETRVIGSIIGYVHAPQAPERVLSLLSSPELHVVTLSITEGGYFIDEETGGFASGHPEVQKDCSREHPRTVFGFIVRALQERRRLGLRPFTVASCDNLPHNGDVARAAVVGYAALMSDDLAAWVADNAEFPNSMVDRVAPYVDDQARQELNQRTGIDDHLAVMAESHIQWVLEDRFADGRPELENVGVQVVDDVSGYETAKLRLLNAPHVLMSYPAVLAGYRIVNEAVADPLFRRLLETVMSEDVLPLMAGKLPADLDANAYIQNTLARFGNRSIQDQLLRVASDGASKIPAFHTAIIRQMLLEGRDIRREALMLACFYRYLSGMDDRGQPFDVTEPSLSPAEQADLRSAGPMALLRQRKFAGLGAADDDRFVSAYRDASQLLQQRGALEAVKSALA
ncbi:MAG: mannitol dehydrogenase family protein [Acidimicrobiales bacterium]